MNAEDPFILFISFTWHPPRLFYSQHSQSPLPSVGWLLDVSIVVLIALLALQPGMNKSRPDTT